MIEWLLAQGEQLPTILVTVLLSVMVGRLLFAKREDVATVNARFDEQKELSVKQFRSVKDAHARLDQWFWSVHTDLVKLFELAHHHAREGSTEKEKKP